jgi:hypothetical protein
VTPSGRVVRCSQLVCHIGWLTLLTRLGLRAFSWAYKGPCGCLSEDTGLAADLVDVVDNYLYCGRWP